MSLRRSTSASARYLFEAGYKLDIGSRSGIFWKSMVRILFAPP